MEAGPQKRMSAKLEPLLLKVESAPVGLVGQSGLAGVASTGQDLHKDSTASRTGLGLPLDDAVT